MTHLHELDTALQGVVEPEEEQEVLLHRQELSKLHKTEDDIKSRVILLGSGKKKNRVLVVRISCVKNNHIKAYYAGPPSILVT
jgi:hypothetical protein